jgi:ATP phosphoribosyltransferase
MRKLKIGLPKGSLQESTFRLFKKAGFQVHVGSRSLYPSFDDPELTGLLLRAQEMATHVGNGILDVGLTGLDWTRETGAKVKLVSDLNYAKGGLGPVRWVLAVPQGSRVRKAEDLEGKRVATELVKVSRDFFKKRGVTVDLEFSWGSTEAKPPLLADAIVELTETGTSLRANKLRIVETVMESTTKLIANHESWKNPWKRKKIENLDLLLQGALLAEEKVGLKMNLERQNLQGILKVLPAIHTPTISDLSDGEWMALEVIIDEKVVRDILPELKRAGASGIVEYPLNKIVL